MSMSPLVQHYERELYFDTLFCEFERAVTAVKPDARKGHICNDFETMLTVAAERVQEATQTDEPAHQLIAEECRNFMRHDIRLLMQDSRS